MQQVDLPLDGFCCGPLFAPVRKVRPAKVRPSGGKEVWAKYTRAETPWTDRRQCAEFWGLSRWMTEVTGVQHSVDHIVPLQHPRVCGLHVAANLRVIPLSVNIRKGNNWWPDMWNAQAELL
jgi:hypothetical protein